MACAERWLGEMLLPLSGDDTPGNRRSHHGATYSTISAAADDLSKSRRLMQHFMEVALVPDAYFIRKLAECDARRTAHFEGECIDSVLPIHRRVWMAPTSF